MGYEIVTAKSVDDLVAKVKLLIAQGWITQGGVVYSSKERFYMQAMITTTGFEDATDQEEDTDDEVDKEVEARPSHFAVSVVGREYVPKEWEEAFWKVMSKEFSKEAMLLIARNHIMSVKELLDEMEHQRFLDEAGESVVAEINEFIKKYNWR